jgi:formate dehydrogenase iron-sulfur subunit
VNIAALKGSQRERETNTGAADVLPPNPGHRRPLGHDHAVADIRHRPQVQEVAKLIDVSTCIGCKACQVACMQWNDLRDEVGTNARHLRQPERPHARLVDRDALSEVEPEAGKLEWLIRKDGCMHCDDPGCLKACPAPGAIVKYSNGIVDFISEHCVGCGNCVTGCPFDVPRISKADNKAYKCSLCSDRVGVGLEPACVKACPTGALHFGTKEDMHEYASERIVDLKERGFRERRRVRPGRRGRHARHVRAAARRPPGPVRQPAERPAHQPAGVAVEGRAC